MSATATSTASPNSINALGRFIFWFSLIVAAIAVYYFFLVERGSEHVYRRNFRSLTQIERQINSSFDRLTQVASTQAVTTQRPKEQQIGGHTYTLQPRNESDKGECAALTNPSSPSDALFKIGALRGNALIDFCIKTTNEHEFVYVPQVPLSDFINPSVALEQFHQVLVFDAERNLIYRSGEDTSDSIKANVHDLLDQNITSHEALVALPDGWLHDDNDKKSSYLKKSEKTNSANDNSSTELIPFSKVREFSIGEEKYLAFLRPIKLNYATIEQPGDTPTWYVVGITTTSEFNASRFVIPRWGMAIFVLALALFILSTPYLKLRLMGPRDLIRSSTISLTVVATLFAAMITTIMLLNLSSYFLTENNIRLQLRASSQLLADAFSNELDAKKAALETIAAEGPKTNSSDKAQFVRASVFDSDANLRGIWSEKDSIKTGGFSVKNRNFWQRLIQSPTLSVEEPDLAYSLENILNRIDGKKITVCAKRIARPYDEITQKSGWTAVETSGDPNTSLPGGKNFSIVTGLFTFNIFSHALLPKGYGFIVIDNSSGIVQYHSEAGADLTEHLYEETDNNPALKTAINTRSPDTFLTNYRGYRYLFHTRPLVYSQWTLVTYFSQALLDRVNLGLLLSATGLGVGFLLLYISVGLLAFKCLSNSKINLLWPNPGQAQGYRQLLILLSALTLAVIAAIARLHADRLFSVIAIAPLAALSGAYICLVRRYQPFQMQIAEQNTLPRDSRAIARASTTLIGASVLIIFALLWANNEWPWQLLPTSSRWNAKFLAHGNGLFFAILFMAAAYFTLWMGLRGRSPENRNTGADWRRALLLLLLLTTCIVVIANLSLSIAVCVGFALLATLTKPLWTHDSSIENRYRCKFNLPIDRRSDRGRPYTLHRICVTLIIVVLVILPAVAFYRDATSLYILRWSQQDAQKLRSQIERLLQNANDVTSSDSCDLKCRFEKIVGENEDYGLLASDTPRRSDNNRPFFSAGPQLSWQAQQIAFNESDSAEARMMRPISQLSHSLARIEGFSKIENDVADDAQFSTWRVTKDNKGQHLIGDLKFSYTDKWLELYWRDYFDFGFLSQYRLWILLALAILATTIIYPMLRLILRELVSEADLRPYPALTKIELDLLLKNYRLTLLLVGGNALDKPAISATDLERDTVIALKTHLVQAADSATATSIAALPDELTSDYIVPDIMVVAETRWQALTTRQSLQKVVCTRVDESTPITWEELLDCANKLRYPDDLPDLALDYWKPDRTITLLVCRNLEAQTTLAAHAAQCGWQPQTLSAQLSDDKIWLHNIEDIIFEPSLRKKLLAFLESFNTHEASRSIVLTGLILPHLWFTEKTSWQGEELGARELIRWAAILARINVRTVNALTIEHQMCEIYRSSHALPRPSREAEYALWWQYSTRDERNALAALTHEGLINPYNRNVIRSLMARGLIFRGSALRFSDKGFKLFVKYKYPVTQLRRQADIELQQSSWGAARGPLLITLAILGYGVMVMGGGAFETVLGLATSIGASIPALLNLARLIKRDNATT